MPFHTTILDESGNVVEPENRLIPPGEKVLAVTLLPASHVEEEEEQDALLAEFQPLLKRLAQPYASSPEQYAYVEHELKRRFYALFDEYPEGGEVPLRAFLATRLISTALTTDLRPPGAGGEGTNPSEGFAPPEDHDSLWAYEVMRQDFKKSLSECLPSLPLKQRQVVTMRYFDSRSLEEIAHLMDVRESTVRTLLRHGINNLRRQLKQSYLGTL